LTGAGCVGSGRSRDGLGTTGIRRSCRGAVHRRRGRTVRATATATATAMCDCDASENREQNECRDS